jgi:phosphohistidine swiveling domain-containing protein
VVRITLLSWRIEGTAECNREGRAMTPEETATEVDFEPPGPGPWEIDAVHFPRPMTRYWAETQPEPFLRGFQEFTAYYGMLLDGMAYRYVNGFAYKQPRPVSEDQIPERFARAEEALEKKLWRDQLQDWETKLRPDSIEAHRELQSVNPDELSDEDLAEYLGRCRDRHAEMVYQHMRFTGAAMLPIGDLLAHAGDWTGLPPQNLLGMMRGAAPVSAGDSEEIERLIAILGKDDSARELLTSDRDPAEILDQLRALDGETGEAVNSYLDLVGYRLLDGFDISGRYALEMPDALVRAIAAAVEGTEGAESDAEERTEEIRDKVPDENKAEFDELLNEARTMYGIRDERGVFSDIWAAGIMRRAALAAGRRLAEKGRINDPEHIIDADLDEMRALILGTNGPSADELAERHEWRTSHDAKDAPASLGPPPPEPPDSSGLPPAVARVMRAMMTTLDAVFGSSQEEHEADLLRGLAASGGTYEGPARRVAGPTEFDRIQKGDVLVTESTSEAFNILLPLLGAIVTDSGGLLSHAAIVAREYGIPGVVGTREGTDRVPDGQKVTVDGDAGEVRF